MNSSEIVKFHTWKELGKTTSICVLLLTVILVFGNLSKYESVLLIAFEHSPFALFKLTLLIIPYALSIAIPFGYSLALSFVVGKWSNFREIDALRCLGQSPYQLFLPVLTFSFPLCLLVLFASLQWGPTNRNKFDEYRENLVWENISSVMEESGEILIPIGKEQDLFSNSALDSLTSLKGEEIEWVTISAQVAGKNIWKYLRICFHNKGDQIQLVVNAQKAEVSRLISQGILNLKLMDIDFEPSMSEKGFFGEQDSLYVSVRELKEPLAFKISQGKKQNLKRVGFLPLCDLANSSPDKKEKRMAKGIISKNLALGLSPAFVAILIIPLATRVGKKDATQSLFLGIILCVGYFSTGTIAQNLLSDSSYSYFSWWLPNLFCLIPLIWRS